MAPLWCDLRCCSWTVVVIKLGRTSAFIVQAALRVQSCRAAWHCLMLNRDSRLQPMKIVSLSWAEMIKFWILRFWKMHWPILQRWFCIVSSPCITEVVHWSLPSHWAETVTAKNWSQFLQYLQSYLQIFIIHFTAAVPLLQNDNVSLIYPYIIKIWPVWMACPWKNLFCWQCSGTKFQCFIQAKRKTHPYISVGSTIWFISFKGQVNTKS